MKGVLVLAVVANALQGISGASNNTEKPMGRARDENGCLLSAGYIWCEALSKCLRPWEEECVTEDDKSNNSVVLAGDDRDEHGCIGSAGYTWCEKLKICARPWELKGEWKKCCVNTKKIVDVSESSSQEDSISDDFVQDLIDGGLDDAEKLIDGALDDPEKLIGGSLNETKKLFGAARDEYGCLLSAGYTWCDSLSKCLRVWEEECVDDIDEEDPVVLPGAEKDEHGCISSAGYRWCEKLKICARSWELEGEWKENCCIAIKDISESSNSSHEVSMWESEDRYNKEEDCDKENWFKGKKLKTLCVISIALLGATICCFILVWASVRTSKAKRFVKLEMITSTAGLNEVSTCRNGETTAAGKQGEARTPGKDGETSTVSESHSMV